VPTRTLALKTGTPKYGLVRVYGAQQGRLYRCSSADTWTIDYDPYPYPHPLVVQSGPTPPANLRTGWVREVLGEYGTAEAR